MNKKKFKKVLVVLGGNSGERAVSLDSGKACVRALKKKKYNVTTFDPKFKNFNLINKNNVVVIPTIIVFQDGEEVKRFQADLSFKMAATKKEVQDFIDELIMSDF